MIARTATPRILRSYYLQLAQAFIQLDIRSPRIRDERERNAQIRPMGIGHVELDPGCFGLFAKCLQALDLETDVIEFASFGAHGRSIAFRERQVHSRQVGGLELPALARLGAKCFGVPGLYGRHRVGAARVRDEEVDMVKL